jgi:Protein of unknown function (DUF3822)
MEAISTQFKIIKKVKDEMFDLEKLHQYTLLINSGVRDFQVGVIANEDNRVLFFEDYVLGEVKDHSEHLEAVKALFDYHELLQAGFWSQVIIGIKNSKFVQVPSTLFSEVSTSDYLKFNAKVEDDEIVLHSSDSSTEAVTVFAIHKGLYDMLKGFYQNVPIKFIHQSHAIISGVLKVSNNDSPLFIYVDRFKLHIVCIHNARLKYYNQFAIKQFSDYVKYIMLVMKSMNMDQETSEVVLWGYVGKNSPHYQEFEKYIRNVSFGGRLPHLKFGFMFDEIQEHHFFDLFSLSLTTK